MLPYFCGVKASVFKIKLLRQYTEEKNSVINVTPVVTISMSKQETDQLVSLCVNAKKDIADLNEKVTNLEKAVESLNKGKDFKNDILRWFDAVQTRLSDIFSLNKLLIEKV